MAGTVPRPFTVIPLDETAQMRTHCVNGMEVTGFVAIDTEYISIVLADCLLITAEIGTFT